MEKYILVIDQGTTSTRVILFDTRGNINGIEQKELKLIYKENQILVDANQIFEDTVSLFVSLLNKVNIDYNNIIGVGITNQRETTVLWNKETGLPVDYAIVWQSTHTKAICDDIRNKGYEELIRNKTGLIINPYFSASKISYILNNNIEARRLMAEEKLLFGTIDSWLLYKLSNRIHKTDYTNASRTMLYNIHTLSWDKELLNLFKIDSSILPEVCSSNSYFADITEERISKFGNFKICSLIGDQQASLFGHTGFNEGSFKITYGTGSFMLLNTSDKIVNSKNGLLTTIAYGIDGNISYAIEGSVFVAGSAFQFVRDNLELVRNLDQENFDAKNNGVYFVPALTGLGAPYWATDARGTIFGLSRATTKSDIVRATLEGVAFLNYDVFKAIEEDSNLIINEVSVDGGASKNEALMQFEADIMNAKIKTISTSEATALGCYYMVGLSVKLFEDLDSIKKLHRYIKEYNPALEKTILEEKYKKWKKAVKATIEFANDLQ